MKSILELKRKEDEELRKMNDGNLATEMRMFHAITSGMLTYALDTIESDKELQEAIKAYKLEKELESSFSYFEIGFSEIGFSNSEEKRWCIVFDYFDGEENTSEVIKGNSKIEVLTLACKWVEENERSI